MYNMPQVCFIFFQLSYKYNREKLICFVILVFLTALNVYSAELAIKVNIVFTVAKVVALAIIIVGGAVRIFQGIVYSALKYIKLWKMRVMNAVYKISIHFKIYLSSTRRLSLTSSIIFFPRTLMVIMVHL